MTSWFQHSFYIMYHKCSLILSNIVMHQLKSMMKWYPSYSDAWICLAIELFRWCKLSTLTEFWGSFPCLHQRYNSLFNNEITSKGATQLFDAFRVGNTKISEIILTRNHIDNECIASLGEYIRSNKYISRISAGYNISDKEIETLSPFIEGNESLKHLNLSGNDQITDLSIPVLVKMVKTSHIEDIEILGTKITKPNALVVHLAQNQLQYGSNKLDLNEK